MKSFFHFKHTSEQGNFMVHQIFKLSLLLACMVNDQGSRKKYITLLDLDLVIGPPMLTKGCLTQG